MRRRVRAVELIGGPHDGKLILVHPAVKEISLPSYRDDSGRPAGYRTYRRVPQLARDDRPIFRLIPSRPAHAAR